MSNMDEARRMPGSEWLKDHPWILELFYAGSKKALAVLYPMLKQLNPAWTERFMLWSEEALKGYLFNCRMCGQCILHSTGMTCPMTCPKNLRNGPCGGVRANGHCEVIPDMPCVWVQAWRRNQKMNIYAGEIHDLQPPADRSIQNTSAWINLFEGVASESPDGWQPISLEK